MGRFQVDDSSISIQLREKKKRKRNLRVTGWSSFRKKKILSSEKKWAECLCQLHIPLDTNLWSQNSLHKFGSTGYIQKTDRSSWPRNFPVLFSTHPSFGVWFQCFDFFFPPSFELWEQEKTLCADYWDYKVFNPLPLLLETETAGPAKGREPWGCCASPRQCMNYEM